MTATAIIGGPAYLLEENLGDLEKRATSDTRAATDGKFAGYVGGWMTVGTRDRDGEVIDQGGVDISLLAQDGWFTDNHDMDQCTRLGFPTKIEKRIHPEHGQAWWIEGPILDTSRGRQLVAQLRALKGTGRQYGFSVEGPKPQRDTIDPTRIVKARVMNVAITDRPSNADARIELIKSLRIPVECASAMEKLEEIDPCAAASLRMWAKSLLAGDPVGNATTGGAALQIESAQQAAPNKKKKRKMYTRQEALERLLEDLGPLGLSKQGAQRVLSCRSDR